ncbi:MAG TPA: glycosyltransferase family 39 protein [Nitrososphaerales archaeon]|nr:glycosyltransferase family 39 protein [Nitrososphaerales archaeon]
MERFLHLRLSLDLRTVVLILAFVVLVIAFISRTYAVGSFPYFPPAAPWNGAQVNQTSLQGLYIDEYGYMRIAQHLLEVPPTFSVFQPPLAMLFLDISTLVLGVNTFGVRLPFAIFSAMTALLVFLIAKKLSKSNILGFASALFYVVMVPALIYGRMAFLDNASAFFFVAMFYFLLKYKDNPGERIGSRWLLAASCIAGLSVLAKITGLLAVLFVLLFLFKEKSLRRSLRFVLPMFVIVAIFPLAVIYVLDFSYLNLITRLNGQYGVFLVGNEIGVWRYFLLSTFPSGYTTWWGGFGGFPKPEFWYVLLYVTLAAVAIKEFPTYSDLILAIGVFVTFVSVVAPPGSYYLIFLQPLLAVTFGPGVRRLIQMPVHATMGIYAFLYVPIAISLGVTTVTGTGAGYPFISDSTLFLWKFLLVTIPLAVLFLSFARYEENRRWKVGYNTFLIGMLLAVLFAASYLSPDLYPQYFYRSAFTP